MLLSFIYNKSWDFWGEIYFICLDSRYFVGVGGVLLPQGYKTK